MKALYRDTALLRTAAYPETAVGLWRADNRAQSGQNKRFKHAKSRLAECGSLSRLLSHICKNVAKNGLLPLKRGDERYQNPPNSTLRAMDKTAKSPLKGAVHTPRWWHSTDIELIGVPSPSYISDNRKDFENPIGARCISLSPSFFASGPTLLLTSPAWTPSQPATLISRR